ncbi:MAG: putative DNA binding domain-containing protein [Planctomycetes bacterium]|nr:putative DNA binding domain-containing protein [Planctomycetota bacterium]
MTLDPDRLLKAQEGPYFERKSAWEGTPDKKRKRAFKDLRDEIAEYVAGFANSDGGTLVVGIEDDGAVTGHGFDDEAVQGLLDAPQTRLKPQQERGERVRVREHELLVFEVESARRAVMVHSNGFPRRIGDQLVLDSEEDINAAKRDTERRGVEREECPRVGLDDLDAVLLRRAATAAGYARGNTLEYLLDRDLAEQRGKRVVIRLGALMLFAGKKARMPEVNAGLRVFVVHGTERKTGARHNVHELPRIEGALPRVIERAYEVLGGVIKRSSKLHDLFFVEQAEYPTFAWQEAVVNAVAHRDYRVQGRCIEVWYYTDRMEFVSPGALQPDVELDALRKRKPTHSSRNPRIVRVLTELGYMREQGEGIPRIFEEMEHVWLPLPEFEADQHAFRLHIRNTPIFDVDDPKWVEHVRAIPGLNDRQRRILVAFRHGSFASGRYQALNQVDRDAAYADLRQLVARGLLNGPESPGRGARYSVITHDAGTRLSSELAPAGEDAKERLDAVMRSVGKLTNATYQECAGIDRRQAKSELSRLVTAAVLTRNGVGRWVTYAAGPRWSEWVYGPQ